MEHKNIQPLLLSEAGEGRKVLIKNIKDAFVKNNLSKLGIFINNELYVSKIDVFGHLISLRTNDAEIAIRKDIADKIEVQVFV